MLQFHPTFPCSIRWCLYLSDCFFTSRSSLWVHVTVHVQLHVSSLLVYRLTSAIMMNCTGLWVNGNDSLASLNGFGVELFVYNVRVSYACNSNINNIASCLIILHFQRRKKGENYLETLLMNVWSPVGWRRIHDLIAFPACIGELMPMTA